MKKLDFWDRTIFSETTVWFSESSDDSRVTGWESQLRITWNRLIPKALFDLPVKIIWKKCSKGGFNSLTVEQFKEILENFMKKVDHIFFYMYPMLKIFRQSRLCDIVHANFEYLKAHYK